MSASSHVIAPGFSHLDQRVGQPAPQAPEISIVVPGLNEGESLPELAQRIAGVLEGKERYELIFVDDGSTDDSWQVISKLASESSCVRGVRLRSNFGKAMALAAGFHTARGEILMMMDADLQDDPEDIPQFIAKVREGVDVVVGWKVNRQDPLNRRLLSKVFNGTVRKVTGVSLHDMNCGFKAYRRDVIRTVPIYGDLFRFIPVLAAARGFKVAEVPVRHHSRAFGRSRYGLERVLRGFFDLMSVVFLTRYARRPMHLFGFIGLLLAMSGMAINLYLTIEWFLGESLGKRPLLQLGILLVVTGVQFGSLGFLGEFMTWQSQMRRYEDDLPIKETVGDLKS
ncbi:MAG TPA: glycosyltransferase family 2 protein [Polyangiaceae bacterium]|nr:glycosyltransferase family 2 protein [Polyangiaceae bacterium]